MKKKTYNVAEIRCNYLKGLFYEKMYEAAPRCIDDYIADEASPFEVEELSKVRNALVLEEFFCAKQGSEKQELGAARIKNTSFYMFVNPQTTKIWMERGMMG